MSPNEIRSKIIQALSKGHFLSGEQLASDLNLSRSSISNYVKSLSDFGLDIFSVKGKGYKFSRPIELLDKRTIEQKLADKPIPSIHVKNIVGSTNDLLKESILEARSGDLIIAECQTQGRGRRGRKWISPFGASIYLSMLWRFESGYQSMAGLSLLIGLAVKRCVNEISSAEVNLKWPNDVYVDNKKLAGILIEVEGQVGGVTDAIIGVGVNVNLPNTTLEIDQAFTDLSSIIGESLDRNIIAASLIKHLWVLLEEFESEGLSPFVEEWREADVYKNQKIKLISGKHISEGVNRGINNSGALLLEIDGEIKTFHGGEISVRKA